MTAPQWLVDLLAEHDGRTISLATPRQYTQHGGWNEACICDYPLGDAGDGDTEGLKRVDDAHRAHVAEVVWAEIGRRIPRFQPDRPGVLYDEIIAALGDDQ